MRPARRPSPARVLVFGPIPPPIHGAARVTALVRERLLARGARVGVVDTGTDAFNLRASLVAVVLRMSFGLLRLLLSPGPLSVYVTAGSGKMLWYQVIVVRIARLRRARVVVHHHSFAYVVADSRPMAALCRAGGSELLHVTLCAGMERQLRERYPTIGSSRVLSNAGLMEAGEVPAARPARDRLVLGQLSNLSTAKGLHEVLGTLDAAVAAGLDVALLLGGPVLDPTDREVLEAAIARHGDRITWLGPVPADQVDSFYDRVDLGLFPSGYRNEAEPLIVLEAARRAVPTMTTALGCLPGMAADPAWVVTDPAAFAEAATAALTAGTFTGDTAGRAARDHFLARREASLRTYDDLIRTLLREIPAA